MARFTISIVVGILLSIIGVALFTRWEEMQIILDLINDPLIAFAYIFEINFSFDMISYLINADVSIFTFFSPQMVAWLFIGYVSGTIAKGVKNGVMAGFFVVTINILLWIILSILASIDLMAMFTGKSLIVTLGGITTAFIGGLGGGVIGGAVSGPSEDYL
ncbi:MAG: hypothetical protein ACOC44_00570 [Promethearchaeia archaeon]